MLERDYRSQIAAVLADVEKAARRLGCKALIPAALGVGLALGVGGCTDDDNNTKPIDMRVEDVAGQPDAVYGIDVLPPVDAGVDSIISGPDAAYAVPFDMRVENAGKVADASE